MRRFYAPNSTFSDSVLLDPEQTKHLKNVLRLSEGEHVNVFDGAGKEFRCRISVAGKKETVLVVEAEVEPTAAESALDLTVAAAMLPGEKFELSIQKAVELGVNRFQPLYSARCEIKQSEKIHRQARWEKISIEAAKQSGRARLMTIENPIAFADFITETGPTDCETILFSERDGESFANLQSSNKIAAIFGPKGGWDELELESARNAGVRIVTFGGRIMRAETAVIAISAILQHRFGDLV